MVEIRRIQSDHGRVPYLCSTQGQTPERQSVFALAHCVNAWVHDTTGVCVYMRLCIFGSSHTSNMAHVRDRT